MEFLGIWLVVAALVGWVAGQRGRSEIGWMALAFFLTPVLAILLLLCCPVIPVAASAPVRPVLRSAVPAAANADAEPSDALAFAQQTPASRWNDNPWRGRMARGAGIALVVVGIGMGAVNLCTIGAAAAEDHRSVGTVAGAILTAAVVALLWGGMIALGLWLRRSYAHD